MARKATYVKKINVVDALKNLETVSYYHVRQLVEGGYVEAEKNPEAKKAGRGRMPLKYTVSKKGQNLIRLSANWAKPVPAEA